MSKSRYYEEWVRLKEENTTKTLDADVAISMALGRLGEPALVHSNPHISAAYTAALALLDDLWITTGAVIPFAVAAMRGVPSPDYNAHGVREGLSRLMRSATANPDHDLAMRILNDEIVDLLTRVTVACAVCGVLVVAPVIRLQSQDPCHCRRHASATVTPVHEEHLRYDCADAEACSIVMDYLGDNASWQYRVVVGVEDPDGTTWLITGNADAEDADAEDADAEDAVATFATTKPHAKAVFLVPDELELVFGRGSG